jgi:hypothetical protein
MRAVAGSRRNEQFPVMTLEAHTDLSYDVARSPGDEHTITVTEREWPERPNGEVQPPTAR